MRSTLISTVKSRVSSALNYSRKGLRGIQTAVPAPRQEGDISSVFASLNGTVQQPLPQRFADLKTRLIAGHEDAVQEAWRELLPRLKREVEEIRELGPAIVPEIEFADLAKGGGANEAFERRLKRTGVAVVRGVVGEEEALEWKEEIREYIRRNPQTKDDPQVYELYWSPPQLKARAHPHLLATQSFLMSFWHSTSPSASLSTAHPVSYCDRLRMRNPGDNRFALGPHSDGGSVERWEEHGYGLGGVYDAIFAGDIDGYDAWEANGRLGVVSDNYNAPGACSMFRMFQGWMSLSNTGPGEGTLLVNPLFARATAYFLLRPFFEAKQGREVLGGEAYLDRENWVLKRQQDSALQGAYPGQCLELSDELHPHLELGSSMVNVPAVRPGDYVVWHCDTIHAVDKSHQGTSDSSVLYIPATPLTEANARYLATQRAHFLQGIPPPDFPGGVGEEGHVGRAGLEELQRESVMARRAMGVERWEVEGSEAQRRVLERANEILGL